MSTSQSDVIIVGAGPVGLALAAQLTNDGITVLVVDDQAAGANTSRAAVVHARTLEVLEPLGAASEMVEMGLQVPLFTVRDRDEILVSVDFSKLATRYPYALMLSQAQTERILLKRLRQLGGEVVRPEKVASIRQDEQGVSAVFSNGAVHRAKFLVGADGMHSTVRDQAGIAFEGGSYKESFSLADVMVSGNLPDRQVVLYLSPDGLVVVAPLPGGSYRVVATVNDAPEVPSVEYIQHLLDMRGPKKTSVSVTKILWGSRFHVHHRVAEHYRAGRIFLAGDAAHVHSPAGGQGMNLGIQDAMALAKILTTAIQTDDNSKLDDYERDQRPIGLRVVELTDRMTRVATAPKLIVPLRNGTLHLLGSFHSISDRVAVQLSGLANKI